MAEIIAAEQLGVGDVYYDPNRVQDGLRIVTAARVYSTDETWRVLEWRRLAGNNRGQTDLRFGQVAHRVRNLSPEDLADRIANTPPGGWLAIYRIGDEIWA